MKNLKIGSETYIQSYKHNHSLHRTWLKALIIDIKDDYYVGLLLMFCGGK